MHLVISALHFIWRDIDEAVERATRTFGLDGVEWSWKTSFARPHCTREDVDRLTALAGRHGHAFSAHIWENLAASDGVRARDDLLDWLNLASKTGVRNLVLHGGSYDDQKQGIARTRQVLERVLPAFERAKVVLNLENHYAYAYRNCRELFSEPWEFQEVLALDSPSLRVCFDTGHGNMTRNTAELLNTLAPWINYVHLADNHGVDDDHVAYRQGTVDWETVFTLLRANGFDGACCVEFPVRDDRRPFDACLADIRRRFDRCAPGTERAG